jgi:hypothetical protein
MTQSKDPVEVQEEKEFEHGSNTFGFFHRYQKVIIYTAGIFTLLTFSITAAITDFFDQIGRDTRYAAMTIPGLGEVVVTEEDHAVAQGIRRVRSSAFTLGYLSPLGVGDSDHQYTEQLAALRAIAVKAGIDASADDVNAINNSAISSFPSVTSVGQLAARAGTNDVTLYNTWMREALRVSTFLRLAVLGVDQTSQAALEAVLDKNEMVSFKVAYIDAKGFKEGVEKSISDEALKKFLDDMEEAKADRYRKPANRVAIKVAMLEGSTFQHEKYLGVELDKAAQIGDSQIQERYQLQRDARYKKPAKPGADKKPAKPDADAQNAADGVKKKAGAAKPPADAKKAGAVKPPADAKKAGAAKPPADAKKAGAVKPPADAKKAGAVKPPAGAKKAGAVKPPAGAKKAGAVKPPADAKKAGEKKGDESKGNGSADPFAQGPDRKINMQSKSGTKPAAQKPAAAQGPGRTINMQSKSGAQPAGQDPDQLSSTGEAVGQDGNYLPLDDALRKKIKAELFSEMVLTKWQASLDSAMATHMADVINAAMTTEIAADKAKLAKAKADGDLVAKPEDAELKKAAEAAKTALEAAEKSVEPTKKAVDARRKEFNFEAEIKKLAKGRPGLKFVTVSEMKDAEGLRKLPELGDWQDSHLPGQMTLAGEIYNGQVQNTAKGSFIFQVSKIEERLFKEFKDIKDDLQEEYLTDRSEKNTKDKKKLFEEALEKLAREQLKDEVAKFEKAGADQIQADFDAWKKGLDEQVTATEKLLSGLDKSIVAYERKMAQLDKIKKELDGFESKKKALKESIDKETEKKIEDKLKEVHKDVLAKAGQLAGLKVEDLGPLSRTVQGLPRFEHRYSNVIQAVFGANASDAKADDVTGVEEDVINEVTFMAVCTKVDKADPKQISRRQWLAELRGTGATPNSFAGNQMQKALNLSFTIEALEKGYGWRPPAGLPSEKGLAPNVDRSKKADDKKADDKKADDKKADDKAPGKDGGK